MIIKTKLNFEAFQELCGWLTTPLLKADLGKMPQSFLSGIHVVNKRLRMIQHENGSSQPNSKPREANSAV